MMPTTAVHLGGPVSSHADTAFTDAGAALLADAGAALLADAGAALLAAIVVALLLRRGGRVTRAQER
jgi:hypothetical protein